MQLAVARPVDRILRIPRTTLLAWIVYATVNLWLLAERPPLPGADWALWRSLPAAVADGSIYATQTDVPYVWSPLFAPIMAAIASVGFVPWALLHFVALAALRDWRLVAFVLASWAFWTDVIAGNAFTFVFVAAALALRGNRAAGLISLALLLVMPRPIQLPLAVLLLVADSDLRRPFIVMFVLHTVGVFLSGYTEAWIGAMIEYGRTTEYDLGLTQHLGRWWLVVGIPIGVWLTSRGRPGWAGLAMTPYLLPQYLLMPLSEVGGRRLTLPRLQRAVPVDYAGLLAPAFFAGWIVLETFHGSPSHWSEVVRPIAVTTAAGVTFATVICLVTRRLDFASVIASLAVVGILDPNLTLIGVALTLGWLVVAQWRSMFERSILSVQRPLLVVAVLLFGMSLVKLPVSGAVAIDDFRLDLPSVAAAERSSGTNVYVALLDGYPRADSLHEFGFDNEPFLDELRAMKFDVYENARSPYPRTEVALAAMLQLDALGELERFVHPDDFLDARRLVRRTYLGDAPAIRALRDAGYQLVYVPSQISHTDLIGWDRTRAIGRLSGFEVTLVQRTLLATALSDWVMDEQRVWLDEALRHWSEPAQRDRLQVVFAHVMAPHVPHLYGEDGGPAPAPWCWLVRSCSLFDIGQMDLSPEAHSAALRGQVPAVNERVLEAVRRIVRDDPTAYVVLLSDHGARYGEINEEWHRILLAARTPGAPDLLADNPTPEALFYRLLSAAKP